MIVVRRGAALAGWLRRYVGRPSTLGNPWSHKPGTAAEYVPGSTREHVIERFAAWLDSLPRDSPQWQEIESMARDVRIGYRIALECSCAPHPCHADVIRARVLTLADT